VSAIRRMFPTPLLSAALWASWLALNASVAPGHVLLGAALAVVVPRLTRTLALASPAMRAPGRALGLALIVLRDIVVANVEVARRILGPERAIRPAFLWVPLEVRGPHGVATLAGIVTLTPGTLSVDVSPDGRWLLVHCLHSPDPEALVAEIKSRYERPLAEIFP
jgi:multicomponent K+:H+ antiporter subunit E